MATTWPTTLPRPEVDGYALAPNKNVRTTNMEVGKPRTRRLSVTVPTNAKVRLNLTLLEFQIFEAWFHWRCKDGAEYFTIPLISGLGVQTVNAQFVVSDKPYEATMQGGVNWDVSFELRIDQLPMMTDAALAAYM